MTKHAMEPPWFPDHEYLRHNYLARTANDPRPREVPAHEKNYWYRLKLQADLERITAELGYTAK